MNIFVAKLASDVDSDNLRSLFEQFGDVASAKVIFDRETGNSRGFGFVEMSDDSEGSSAIKALDASDYQGRKIVVKRAEPRDSYQSNKKPLRPRSNFNDRSNDRNNKRF
ncbi:MAG: hypothetical protein RIS47_2322 [Bacteroidota bacterium]|jgi:RNA recognition motif-containing protein